MKTGKNIEKKRVILYLIVLQLVLPPLGFGDDQTHTLYLNSSLSKSSSADAVIGLMDCLFVDSSIQSEIIGPAERKWPQLQLSDSNQKISVYFVAAENSVPVQLGSHQAASMAANLCQRIPQHLTTSPLKVEDFRLDSIDSLAEPLTPTVSSTKKNKGFLRRYSVLLGLIGAGVGVALLLRSSKKKPEPITHYRTNGVTVRFR